MDELVSLLPKRRIPQSPSKRATQETTSLSSILSMDPPTSTLRYLPDPSLESTGPLRSVLQTWTTTHRFSSEQHIILCWSSFYDQLLMNPCPIWSFLCLEYVIDWLPPTSLGHRDSSSHSLLLAPPFSTSRGIFPPFCLESVASCLLFDVSSSG